jgi:hypothetical protein
MMDKKRAEIARVIARGYPVAPGYVYALLGIASEVAVRTLLDCYSRVGQYPSVGELKSIIEALDELKISDPHPALGTRVPCPSDCYMKAPHAHYEQTFKMNFLEETMRIETIEYQTVKGGPYYRGLLISSAQQTNLLDKFGQQTDVWDYRRDGRFVVELDMRRPE